MSYPYTGTQLNSSTQTGLSTQILVQVDGLAVGGIQSLRVNQRRPLRAITEVGTDGNIEIVPNAATTFELSIERIYFDRKTITESLGRSFLNIQAQRYPFDIYIYDFHNVPGAALDPEFGVGDPTAAAQLAANGIITTVYENVWIGSLDTTYSSGDYIIMQNISATAEFCHSHIGPVSSAADGVSGIPGSAAIDQPLDSADGFRELRNLEKLVDVSRPGSMDARALRNLGNLSQFR
jgi:hypothetical protein